MEEKALCGICEKKIDSYASKSSWALKAVGLERIIQFTEDIPDGLADRIHRKKHYQFQFMQDIFFW